MIRITKIFRFESAHLLLGYNGPCKNIHGHSYELHVTVKGVPINDDSDSNNGMVLEFSIIKDLVNEEIINNLDHALILPERVDKSLIETLKGLGQKVVFTNYQPTCENLLTDFARVLNEKLPNNIQLQNLRLYETASSYAEWCLEDQTNT
ncbi:MAG: 6-carboxytetrahydropterin synthase [Bacteroidota bacterium]